METRKVSIVVACLALATWWVTLTFGFVWDDFPTIVNNSSLHQVSTFWQAFTHDFWGLHDVPERSGYWRPVPTVIYTAVVQIFGVSAVALHALSLLMHIGVSLLALRLLSRLGASGTALLVASLFFAVHPLHAETVSFVSALPDLCAAFFGLAAVLIVPRRILAGLALFALALLSKESSVVFPILGLLIWERGRRGRLFWMFLGLAVVYSTLHALVVGSSGMRPLWGGTLERHLGTVLDLLPFEFLLTLTPFATTPTRPFPVSEGWTDPMVWTALATVVTAGFLAWRFRKGLSWLWRGLLLFVVCWLPISNLVPLEGLIADRYLYLPSIGTALLVGEVLSGVCARVGRAGLCKVGLGILLLLWSGLAVRSAYPWRNENALWARAVDVSPSSSLAWNEWGRLRMEKGEYDPARKAFENAVALQPGDISALKNIILVNLLSGDIVQARRSADDYVERFPQDAAGWDLRASVADVSGDFRGTIESAEVATRLAPEHWKYHFNLGTSLLKARRTEDALPVLREAYRLAPERREVAVNFAAALFQVADWNEAKKLYETIAHRWPEETLAVERLRMIRQLEVLQKGKR